MTQSHSSLVETVKKGNDWMIRNWPDDKIWPHLERLHQLNLDLIASGYDKCLYDKERCNEIPTCFVCSKRE
jgi:hypothetical protein